MLWQYVLIVAATAVTFATLTRPVGATRLLLWKLEVLVVPGGLVFDVGVPENSRTPTCLPLRRRQRSRCSDRR